MKLIHLISGGDVGGAKTHVFTLLSGLMQTETVLLVCFVEGPFAESARALGIPTKVLSGSLTGAVRQLEQLIRAEGFEIIHCHGSRANLVGSILKSRLGLPTVTTVHSDYRLDYMGRPLAALTYGNLNKRALRKMDFWIGVSDETTDMLHERGFDPNRTFVISNGVPFRTDPPALDREAFLRSVGLEPEDGLTVFGIAARISPVKDMTTLIRAFSAAVRVCPMIRLIVAGDGEQREQIEALAKQTCPAGTVAFAGWVSDMHSFYSALDVNLLTSLSEGFPYALPEGASHRCATIATGVGGIPALVEHEVSGLLFAPKDVQALTDHMVRLAEHPDEIRTFADRIYEKTKRLYSAEATVSRQKEIYAAVLRRTARAEARKRDGILICGAYGRGNSGDDAILCAMINRLRAIDPDIPICVTSRSPAQTAREARVKSIYTFRFLPLRRQLKQTALYLSGGGSLIQDSTSSRSLWYYLHSIRTAKKTGNRVMMFGCGVGPVRSKLNRRFAARIIQNYVDAITLRDSDSADELKALGVTGVPVRVTADIALLVSPAPEVQVDTLLRQAGLSPDTRYLIIAPRPWPGLRPHLTALAAAAQYAARTYGLHPIFLAMEPGKDLAVCETLSGMMGEQPATVLSAPDKAHLIVGLIHRADCMLGMRLHSLIFAASGGVPFCGISYDPKVRGFLSDAGQGECCEIEDLSEPLLCGMIDRMQNDRERFHAASEAKIEQAEENARLAFELLK